MNDVSRTCPVCLEGHPPELNCQENAFVLHHVGRAIASVEAEQQQVANVEPPESSMGCQHVWITGEVTALGLQTYCEYCGTLSPKAKASLAEGIESGRLRWIPSEEKDWRRNESETVTPTRASN